MAEIKRNFIENILRKVCLFAFTSDELSKKPQKVLKNKLFWKSTERKTST
jgi:hypothetical protein